MSDSEDNETSTDDKKTSKRESTTVPVSSGFQNDFSHLFNTLDLTEEMNNITGTLSSLDEVNLALNVHADAVDAEFPFTVLDRVTEATTAWEEFESTADLIGMQTDLPSAREMMLEELIGFDQQTNVLTDSLDEVKAIQGFDQAPSIADIMEEIDIWIDTIEFESGYDDSPALLHHERLDNLAAQDEPSLKECQTDELYVEMAKRGEFIPCSNCDNFVLPRNAGKYRKAPDGGFLCPNCADSDRSFH